MIEPMELQEQLHLLHVAALLPPQARLEHLEKALVTWRLIRRTASKSFEDCMPNSERSPQATISIRALGTDVVQLSWGLGSFREPCFRKTSAPQLSSRPRESIRELAVTQKNSALWSTSYPQRFRELLRFVPPPAPAPTTNTPGVAVESGHRCRGRFEARLPLACTAAEMGPRARDHRCLIEAPHQINVL